VTRTPAATRRLTTLAVLPALALALVATGSCRRASAGGADSTQAAAASDSLSVALEDEVGGPPSAGGPPAPLSPDSLDACTALPPSEPTKRMESPLVTITLPADFEPLGAPTPSGNGTASYQWRGEDGSRVQILASGASSAHEGWTGPRASECDFQAAGAQVHVDVLFWGLTGTDRTVRAWFDLGGDRPRLQYVAHARTLDRQDELLRAVRTVWISTMWGVRQ
jgi:hypothetical protein